MGSFLVRQYKSNIRVLLFFAENPLKRGKKKQYYNIAFFNAILEYCFHIENSLKTQGFLKIIVDFDMHFSC